MSDAQQPTKPSRKGKEREPAQADLFYDRLIAMQRSKAAATRPRDKSERPSRAISPTMQAVSPPPRKVQQPAPQVVVSRSTLLDNPDEFHRRRKPTNTSPRALHSSAHHSKAQSKLFNPDVDPVPMRRTAEPEVISDNGSSSYAPRKAQPSPERGARHGRLFDYRKDDPVRFHVLKPTSANGNRPTPTPKSSGDYVSASSTSSYAHSITSSNFTLNSTTDGSSASSALFDEQPREHASSSAFAQQLKKLYRGISTLEARLLREDVKDFPDEGRITLKRPNEATAEPEEAEKDKWRKFVADHKQLAESMHNLLQLTLAPHVPASLRNIPTKYNIIIRLWTHAFYKPLETLRRASFHSAIALEHLQEFIIYAYTFYSMLLEEQTLENFKSGWLEALGDLSRYRMAIAAMTAPSSATSGTGEFTPVNQQALAAQTQPDESLARIDDSPGPSVGVAAARALELEPEKERWRCIARDWYAAGLSDMPGTGKLHHHLGLLSRDVEKEELRAVYHFCKSMTTLHPFPTSRESVLQIWSVSAQTRRALPDSRATELFMLLHGMLFTNVQLDDFLPTLARFMERLQLEDAEERDWIMMAVINVTALLGYGKPTGFLRSTGGIGGGAGASKDTSSAAQAAAASAKVNMLVRRVDEMEVDDTEGGAASLDMRPDIDDGQTKTNGILNVSPVLVNAHAMSSEQAEPPLSLKYAMQLTFGMFAFTLRKPTRTATPFSRPSLNPYNTVILTFLATVMKHPAVQKALERVIPWDAMVCFFNTVPRSGLSQAEGGIRLTNGCVPLPEDWCLRGMEWGGRRVFERGFWKSGEERHVEMEVLDTGEEKDGLTDGIIEDEDDETEGRPDASETSRRWVRIARAAGIFAKIIPGFCWETGSRTFTITNELEEKVKMWKEEDRLEREEDERRRSRRPWINDEMDIDIEESSFADEFSEDESGSSSDGEVDEEIKALKAKRRELLRQLRSTSESPKTRTQPRRPRASTAAARRPSLRVVPGYTVLVVDTNILLSSLSMFSSLVESLRWTVLVPLAVITELDGIAMNASSLGEAATAAITYISAHIRSHALSLKVQTSRGNYLQNLNVRSEQVEFVAESWERSMDDLILRAAVWQDDHWVDRSSMLKAGDHDTSGAAKVVLITFDRNLRLKARARQLDAADERDMAEILKAKS
ncbi:hypothetical protein M0805_003047 [Coniferiporia weirii]|nr:hypothetical protein M0805_003047 [Coniferiporia weirii]